MHQPAIQIQIFVSFNILNLNFISACNDVLIVFIINCNSASSIGYIIVAFQFKLKNQLAILSWFSFSLALGAKSTQ